MHALRYILMALSAGGVIFMLYAVAQHPRDWPIAIPCAVGLLVNFLFLWTTRTTKSEVPSRIVRLIRLWLDAKEADLKRRAGV